MGRMVHGRNGERRAGDARGAEALAGLKRALDVHTEWPAEYVFKFIVPAGQLNHLLALLDGFPLRTRDSSGGRFVSVTAEVRMRSSDDVIAVYERTAVVQGLISL